MNSSTARSVQTIEQIDLLGMLCKKNTDRIAMPFTKSTELSLSPSIHYLPTLKTSYFNS